jgi:hydrogenase maturation protease
MTWTAPVRLIGIGSPHGDDAVGWEVVRRLQSRLSNKNGIHLHRLHGGNGLLHLLDGTRSLLLIDAAITGSRPGTIHRWTWPDERLAIQPPGSTHGLGLAETLRLAETLGLLPPTVAIIAIEGRENAPGTDLEPVIASLVEQLAAEFAEL